MSLKKPNYKCPYCEYNGGIEINGCDDATIDFTCKHCGESGTIEPDGFGFGGLEWAEAMAHFSGDEDCADEFGTDGDAD